MKTFVRATFEGLIGEYDFGNNKAVEAHAEKHKLRVGSVRTIPRAPTKEQFTEKELELVRDYAPEVRTCGTCFWPVLKPNACTTCGETNP